MSETARMAMDKMAQHADNKLRSFFLFAWLNMMKGFGELALAGLWLVPLLGAVCERNCRRFAMLFSIDRIRRDGRDRADERRLCRIVDEDDEPVRIGDDWGRLALIKLVVIVVLLFMSVVDGLVAADVALAADKRAVWRSVEFALDDEFIPVDNSIRT